MLDPRNTDILSEDEITKETREFVAACAKRITHVLRKNDVRSDVYIVFLTAHTHQMLSRSCLHCIDDKTGLKSMMRLGVTDDNEFVIAYIAIGDIEGIARFKYGLLAGSSQVLASTLIKSLITTICDRRKDLNITSQKLSAVLHSLEDMFEAILNIASLKSIPQLSCFEQTQTV